jgi:hypothetical protein
MRSRIALPAALVLAACACQAAERWKVQFFHDEDASSLVLQDLKFPSPRRGIAAGYLVERGTMRPVVLLTSDGGGSWETIRVREAGRALFFLNDSLGWMVTDKGIWRTDESGRNWLKVASLRGIAQVHFADDKRGWAVGAEKSIYETSDGGKKWARVAAAATPKTTTEYTTYGCIAFATDKVGVIAGWSRPPQGRNEERLPAWIDPERARRRELPAVTVLLETKDGGRNWSASQSSLFGMVSRISVTPSGQGLGLLRFTASFPVPSEVYKLDWQTGKSERVFRRKDRMITDVAYLPGGRAYLAGVESAGLLADVPIPGRLKLLRSDDLSKWQEMDVDYRASARRAVLAAAGPNDVWVATDTGMILKLVSD